MQLITHQNRFDLKTYIQARHNQLTEDSEDIPPNIPARGSSVNITGPNYAFIGPNGLLTDLWEEHEPQQNGFVGPFEFVSYWPDLKLYEVLFLVCGVDGCWILIPEEIVEMPLDLKWILTDQSLGGLSEPMPL